MHIYARKARKDSAYIYVDGDGKRAVDRNSHRRSLVIMILGGSGSERNGGETCAIKTAWEHTAGDLDVYY